jgi:hypothetical protein
MGQTYNQYSDLPTVFVETYNHVAITSKVNYVYGKLTYLDGDSIAHYDSLAIRGRGNSTWGLAKKPYRIKFNQKEKFLGKGYAKAKSWTLLANAADKSMIRDALTSELGELIGLKFNPAARFVDFVLNGTYLGTYQISDQVEVRAHRVNVTEQPEVLTDTTNITGGYLLEVDGFQDGNCFSTAKGVPVRIHYPDEDVIAKTQNNYITNYVLQFENTLFSSFYKDPTSGYRRYVDSLSLARWYIATEITANPDGLYSIYFYKDQNDPKLYWGPLWDYDIAYNNCARKQDVTNELMCDYGFGQGKYWVDQMWQDPWFGSLINNEYKQIVESGLENKLLAKADSLANLLSRSQALNYKTWSINQKMYSDELVLFNTYDEYISYLKDFITNHMSYLTTAFAEKQIKPAPTPTPAFSLVKGYYYRITNAGTNTAMDVTNQQTYDDATICAWANDPDRESEEWIIKKIGNYYQLINHTSGMVLNDPATLNQTAQLDQEESDTLSKRQLWTFYPQGTAGYYNIINAYTGNIANLSGGSAANGTPILSYFSDTSRNATSNNRLWYIMPTEIPIVDGINEQEIDYALTYSRVGQRLCFLSPDAKALNFTAHVYSITGQQVGSFRSDEEFSLSSMPHGTYIVTWSYSGRKHSCKFNY